MTSFKMDGHLESTGVLWLVGEVQRLVDVLHAENVTEERFHIKLFFGDEPQRLSERSRSGFVLRPVIADRLEPLAKELLEPEGNVVINARQPKPHQLASHPHQIDGLEEGFGTPHCFNNVIGPHSIGEVIHD